MYLIHLLIVFKCMRLAAFDVAGSFHIVPVTRGAELTSRNLEVHVA